MVARALPLTAVGSALPAQGPARSPTGSAPQTSAADLPAMRSLVGESGG